LCGYDGLPVVTTVAVTNMMHWDGRGRPVGILVIRPTVGIIARATRTINGYIK